MKRWHKFILAGVAGLVGVCLICVVIGTLLGPTTRSQTIAAGSEEVVGEAAETAEPI